jgi:hypothetical protein
MTVIKRNSPQPTIGIIADSAIDALNALLDRHCPGSTEIEDETLPETEISLDKLLYLPSVPISILVTFTKPSRVSGNLRVQDQTKSRR